MKLLICLALASVVTTVTCGFNHHRASGAIGTDGNDVDDIVAEATGTRESRTNTNNMEMEDIILTVRGY